MRKFLYIFSGILIAGLGGYFYFFQSTGNGAPPYVIEDLEPPVIDPYAWINEWVRPEGPARVGLQVGHWKNSELPDELARLRGNTGATGGGKAEWEVNLVIAQGAKAILEKEGIIVDILPSTVPEKYWADVFVAIHADGSTDWTATGFKVATPRRDFSGGADSLLRFVENSYTEATGLAQDPNITNNMRGYYAFAWWRYTHAVHPRTASIILETGFLTNALDRKIIINNSEVSAKGLAVGVIEYLKQQKLL